MKAEEIRKASAEFETRFSKDMPWVSPEVACLKLQVAFFAEIAAQLAELNETLKNKSSLPGTEP